MYPSILGNYELQTIIGTTIFFNSQQAKELSAKDIFFSALLSQSVDKTTQNEVNTNNIYSYQVLLAGGDPNPSCLAHIVHIFPVCKEINLFYFLEVGNMSISSSVYETFIHLHTMQTVQIQRDTETLRPAFNNLDTAIKKLFDALKKSKNHTTDNCLKQLTKKWEMIRKKYMDFIKNSTDESLLRAETLSLGLLENLKELLSLMSVDGSIVYSTQKQTKQTAENVSKELNNYKEFFKVKAMKNFSLGSYPFI